MSCLYRSRLVDTWGLDAVARDITIKELYVGCFTVGVCCCGGFAIGYFECGGGDFFVDVLSGCHSS